MVTLAWFLIGRWNFKRGCKDIPKGMDMFSAMMRNNVCGCRYRPLIQKDMKRILNKSPN